MVILRFCGMAFLILAMIAMGIELVGMWQTGQWRSVEAGQLWINLHYTSLATTHELVERHIHPAVWNPLMMWILRQPAWTVAGLPGIALLLIGVGLRLRLARDPRRPRFRTS